MKSVARAPGRVGACQGGRKRTPGRVWQPQARLLHSDRGRSPFPDCVPAAATHTPGALLAHPRSRRHLQTRNSPLLTTPTPFPRPPARLQRPPAAACGRIAADGTRAPSSGMAAAQRMQRLGHAAGGAGAPPHPWAACRWGPRRRGGAAARDPVRAAPGSGAAAHGAAGGGQAPPARRAAPLRRCADAPMRRCCRRRRCRLDARPPALLTTPRPAPLSPPGRVA
jgi:hypothetical protein